MRVTAKVMLTGKDLVSWGTQYESVNLRFNPDYANGKNKEWAAATPTLSLTMSVKPSVGSYFKMGESYTLTFIPDDEPVSKSEARRIAVSSPDA